MKGQTQLSQRYNVLFGASLERRDEAAALLSQQRWTLAMYVSGLSVEALLQAHAVRNGAPRDAKHDLSKWLNKCPSAVVDAVKATAATEWSTLLVLWSNELRYLSLDALIGRLREIGADRGIKLGKEGHRSLAKVMANRCVRSAAAVHDKGMVLWQSPTTV